MIYRAHFILTMMDAPIEGGEVMVRGGRIEAVGTDVSSSFPDESVTDFGHAAIMPGLVNLHTHLDYTIARGLLDDEPFFPWIRRLSGCSNLLSYGDFLASARLGAMQLVRSGVTAVADSTNSSGAAAEAIREAGLRGAVFQETFGPDNSKDYTEQVDQLAERIADLQSVAGDRVTIGVSPHSAYTASEPLLRKVADLARDMSIPIAIHVAETGDEAEFIRAGEGTWAGLWRSLGYEVKPRGKTPVEYLHDLGILGPRTIAAHCVHVSPHDIDILAHERTSFAHCPKSNAKLAVGTAPMDEIVSRGIVTGIGTDSAASCNSLDMFEEMRFAVLAQRMRRNDARAMDAQRVLELATLGGATALGLELEIGTIEIGKRADLVAVDLSSTAALSAADPYSAIVYSCSAADVLLTLIDGRDVYSAGTHSRVDASEVRRRAALSASKLALL